MKIPFKELLLRSPRLIAFGLALTFFSSYGQTFLISLYIPEIEAAFGFSNTDLSSLYAVATLSAAFSLPWLGGLLDRRPLRAYTSAVLLGLALACVSLSLAIHPLWVGLSFFGMRLFGQGLMSHTSVSTMARAFEAERGQAISLATLGHSLGKVGFPILIILAIEGLGWRQSLQLSALSLVIFVLPLVYWLLRGQAQEVLYPIVRVRQADDPPTDRWSILRGWTFWKVAPTLFSLGFLNTAIFFFQLKLGNSRGWSPEFVAGSFSVYAIAGAVATAVAGPLVDRLTARRLFPWFLLPYLVGLALLASFSQAWVYPVSLGFVALANGFGGTTLDALYAEVYGTAVIGQVRALFVTVMVISTALGPFCFGLLLDAGWSWSAVFGAGLVYLLGVMAWASWGGVARKGRND
ncbi:MAG: MFS transporter [Bacteroidota bacterium]